jgi:N-acetylglucosaminyl-diphospho-decaprenol L-rhamnosyltransferase
MTSPPADVSVILVNYNTEALLEPCLGRLASALKSLRSQVIIVDNASRDGSVAVLRERFSQYEIVLNASNVGFGRANNQVLGQASGRYVLLLNTDAYVEPDALVKSIAFMDANPRTGVLGARLVALDGELQPCCRYFPTPWSVFLLRTGLNRFFPSVRMVDDMSWRHDTVRQCDWVPGCYYLIRKEVIDAVGLFDPRFFLYYEEVDHCKAVREAGWDVTFFPHTTVVHLGGESAKSDASLSARGRQISTLQAESELLFFRKHLGATGAWLALSLGLLADGVLFLKGLVRKTGGETASSAWRNAALAASVFRATRGGRRATR